jgi:hypothetical protein
VKAKDPARQDRLAEALRENLRRRKARRLNAAPTSRESASVPAEAGQNAAKKAQ